VYIAVQGRTAAVALADGAVKWKNELTPSYAWLGSLAAITVADGAAVSNVSRNDGMAAWSTANGAPRWKLAGGKTTAIHATPVYADGDLIFINSAGVVTRTSLSGTQDRWSRALVEGGNEWSYSITAAPALANGRLFVPTQYQELVALDADSGAPLWHHATRPGPLNFAHYRAAEPGFTASPVVTGDLVWVPHPDGTLVALAAIDGHELWKTNLGAPIVSSPAPAGDTLVVATFDGVVRALVPSRDVTPGPSTCIDPFTDKPDELETDTGGCCESGSSSSTTSLLFAGLLARLLRRRRARSSIGDRIYPSNDL
jgi:outer membrane protein assembly factor BamB